MRDAGAARLTGENLSLRKSSTRDAYVRHAALREEFDHAFAVDPPVEVTTRNLIAQLA
jgi:hypothetical protein